MSDLLCDDDFELDAAGYFRNASPVEGVRQEIGRLAEEKGWVAAPLTPALAAEMQAGVLALLREHPDVTTPGAVTVRQSDGSTYISATFDGQETEVSL